MHAALAFFGVLFDSFDSAWHCILAKDFYLYAAIMHLDFWSLLVGRSRPSCISYIQQQIFLPPSLDIPTAASCCCSVLHQHHHQQ